VRPTGAGAHETVRVELRPDTALPELYAAVAEATGRPSNVLRLSLNKTTPLEGGALDTVSSLGICGGDLLWILPGSSGDADGPTLPQGDAGESDLQGARANIDRAPAPAPTSSPVAEAASVQPLPQSATPAGEGRARVRMPADAEEAPAADEIAGPPDCKMTDHVTGMAESESMCSLEGVMSTPVLPSHLLRVVRANKTGDVAAAQQDHVFLALATHAACLEAGLVLRGENPALAELPVATWTKCSSVYDIEYVVPHGQSPGALLLPFGTVRFSVLGRFLVATGVSQLGARCETFSVTLSLEECLAPSAGHEACASSLPSFASYVSRLRNLKALWVKLKDGLCLPLLHSLCRASGVEPPTGLLSLPGEIKDDCLGLLSAKELAALMVTCTGFRHYAASDAFWKPLYERDFPGKPPVPGVPQGPPQAINWWAAYRARVLQRQEAERRYQQALFNPLRAPMRYPMPPGPFVPIPGPRIGPNFITGGDFDRLPAPLLGQPSFGSAGGIGSFGGLRPGGLGMPRGGSSGRRGSTRTFPTM